MIKHRKSRKKRERKVVKLDNKYVNDNFEFVKKNLSIRFQLSYKRYNHYISEDSNLAIINIRERDLIDLLEADDSSKCLVLNSGDKIEKVMNFRSYRVDFSEPTHDIILQDDDYELKRHELVKVNRNHFVVLDLVNIFVRSEKTVYCSEGSIFPIYIEYKRKWWLCVPPLKYDDNKDGIVPIGEREIKDKSKMKKIND